MEKIYVIGSMKNSKEIEYVARGIKATDSYLVRYAYPIGCTNSLTDAIEKAFANIRWCNSLYVVKKADGSLGDGTLYEIAYARTLHKEIIFVN